MWKRVWFFKDGEISEGNFLLWGSNREGASQAIIMIDNGKVEMAYPTDIQFVEPGSHCVLEKHP